MTDNQPIVGLIRQTKEFYDKSDKIYRRLEWVKSEIRVLHLLPAPFQDDSIKVKLKHVSLNEDPTYTAISYTWAHDGTDLRTIDLEGVSYQITPNQHMALKRLRFADRLRIVWMDVICINQANGFEREIYVRMMADIYRKCSELIIWLGESISPDSFCVTDEDIRESSINYESLRLEGRTLRYPRSLTRQSPAEFDLSPLKDCDGQAAAFHVLDLLCTASDVLPLPFDVLHSDDLYASWLRGLKALKAVLTLPWWSRAWTFQETILPASTGRPVTVHLGANHTPFVRFINLGRLIVENQSYGPGLGTFLPGLDPWNHAHMIYTLSDNIQRQSSGIGLTYENAYSIARTKEATDPRDKIYAFLSLLEDHHHLPVDYSEKLPYIFTAATYFAIMHSHFPDFLTKVSIATPNRHGLPSWCLDWDLPRGEFPSQNFTRSANLYEYSHQTVRNHVRWSYRALDHLFVNAIEIGTIAATTHVTEIASERSMHEYCLGLRRKLLDRHDIMLDDDNWHRLNFQDSHFEPEQEHQRLDKDALRQIASWETCGSQCDDSHCPAHFTVRLAFNKRCDSTRTFITECGNVGIGHHALQIGDKVFYIPGFPNLSILRQQSAGDVAGTVGSLRDSEPGSSNVESQAASSDGGSSERSTPDTDIDANLETYQVVGTTYASNWVSAIDGSRNTERIRLA